MNKNWRKLPTPIDCTKLCEAYCMSNWRWWRDGVKRFPLAEELKRVVDDLLARRFYETGGLAQRDDGDGGVVIMADPKIAKAYETLNHEEAHNPD